VGDIFDIITAPFDAVTDLLPDPLSDALKVIFPLQVVDDILLSKAADTFGFPTGKDQILPFVSRQQEEAIKQGAFQAFAMLAVLAPIMGKMDGTIGEIGKNLTGITKQIDGMGKDFVGVIANAISPHSERQAAALTDLFKIVSSKIAPKLGLSTTKSAVQKQAMRSFIRDGMVSPRYGAFRRSSFDEILDQIPSDERQEIEAERAKIAGAAGADTLTGGTEKDDVSEPGAMEAVAAVIGHGWNKFLSAIPDWAQEVVKAEIAGTLPTLFAKHEAAAQLLALVREKIESTFGSIGQQILEGSTGPLDTIGPIQPGGHAPVAREMLGRAFGLGHEAHLLSSLAEVLHPIKHLGLPQIAALMADMAGFKEIVQADRGTRIKVALQRPAEYHANMIHRTRLLAPAEAQDLVQKRLLTVAAYKESLRYQGFDEDAVESLGSAVWLDPNLRTIGMVLDDSEVDPSWLRDKLNRTGLEDADVDLWEGALQRRAVRTFRHAYLNTVTDNYRDGFMDASSLESELLRLGVTAPARELIVARANLERHRTLAAALLKAAQESVDNREITVDEYRAVLAGLGMEPDFAAAAAALAEAKLTGKTMQKEQANLDKLLNQDRAARIQLAQESFRRYLIEPDEMRIMLEGIGVEPDFAQAIVSLAAIKREPVPKQPATFTPAAQAEVANKALEEAAIQSFRKGLIDEKTLEDALTNAQADVLGRVALALGDEPSIFTGLNPQLAKIKATVAREKARRVPTPKDFLVFPAPDTRPTQIQTEAALALFRNEKLDEAGLRVRLKEIGHSPAMIEALVSRELARTPLPKEPAPAKPPALTAEEKRRIKLAEDIAKQLFRSGVLDRDGAENLMVNGGVEPLTAQLLMDLEDARAEAKAASATAPDFGLEGNA
jgi:hypothetical protein